MIFVLPILQINLTSLEHFDPKLLLFNLFYYNYFIFCIGFVHHSNIFKVYFTIKAEVNIIKWIVIKENKVF